MNAVAATGGAHPIDDLLPYLLGELDPLSRTALERHLDRCATCRAELARLDAGFVATVEALPPEPPSEAVWNAIAERTAAPARAPGTTVGPASATAGRRARPARGAWPTGLVAALALAAAVGVWGVGQRQLALELRADLAAARLAGAARATDLNRTIDALEASAGALAEEHVRVVRWLSDTDVTVAAVAGDAGTAVGAVLYRNDGAALVVMRDAAGADRSFQAWGVAGGAVTSLGTFEGRVLEVPADGFEAVAISLEPLGGSAAPTDVLGAAPRS